MYSYTPTHPLTAYFTKYQSTYKHLSKYWYLTGRVLVLLPQGTLVHFYYIHYSTSKMQKVRSSVVERYLSVIRFDLLWQSPRRRQWWDR